MKITRSSDYTKISPKHKNWAGHKIQNKKKLTSALYNYIMKPLSLTKLLEQVF